MGIARASRRDYGQRGMSDGKRFDQALRALDKFIAEQARDEESPPDAGERDGREPRERDS
jgi:hypothetical protein